MVTFSSPLLEGTLIQRYKRFFADVRLAGTGGVVTAHVANTGSMKTCGAPGDTVYLLPTPDPKRKLAYNWELTRIGDGLVGVNTARPNHVVAAAVRAGRIEELKDATFVRQEAKYGAGFISEWKVTSNRVAFKFPSMLENVMRGHMRPGWNAWPNVAPVPVPE